ncbi:TetR/AcrR family transcriptional regulator [Stappia sp. F7233]|uniref:TetR/AcrR family transcriptional regulator n=1 Tax=Stappia albiluteola TaxID=2758565 RepID=A0A839AHK4_9HYPH|nr:TetR/AcrR family transcriptional regulator [Stappia albiluteola]MBA5778518.1 TetR/AcrR family transcriptional regulator [Stappia albiluteola]
MARPREFEIDEALEMAMHVFWSKGYEATTLPDLLDAMGISRGSFYKAFHDKRSVYFAALERYEETRVGVTVGNLTDSSNGRGRDRIADLFTRLAAADGRDGCFLCNAAIDRAPHDPEVEARVNDMIRRLEGGFRHALQEDRPALSPDVLQSTTRSLVVSYFGLQVLGTAGLDNNIARDCLTQVLRMLDEVIGK